MKRLGLYYGITGAVLSLLIFMALQNLLRATDVQGFILIGTVTLSSAICFCTGILVDTYKDSNTRRKE